jgi:23S rRNA (uracil1939-C5)-methyltransferase
MEFGIGPSPSGPVIGLRERGRFDRIFDLEECPIFSPRAGPLAAAVEAHARARGYGVYDGHRQRGFLRHLLVRESAHTPDLLVALVTSPGALDETGFVAAVLEAAPATSVWHVVTASRANVVEFGEARLLHGLERIAEDVPPLRLEFGPGAFLQTNTRMAERLYRRVREVAAFRGGESLVDLYCGIGVFALYLARGVRRVVGLEGSAGAVADARRNAALNRIENAEFHIGDDRRGFPDALERLGGEGVDAILLDPPRGGVHARTLSAVARAAPPLLLYVSCNPATLARDLAALTGPPACYRVELVEPFDLFPHTPHVETLVRLTRS